MIRTYTELSRIKTFTGRYEYLRLSGTVGKSTFGYDRIINQILYRSDRWKTIRNSIIIRDEACDLGIDGRELYDKIVVHHMNPITVEDIELEKDLVFDPEFLICTSLDTHNAIHFGDVSLLRRDMVRRTPNDTCPWR